MRTLAVLLLLTVMACNVTQAQSDIDTSGFEGFKNVKILPARQNVVKFSPFPFIVGQIPVCGELRITYERLVAHNQSILIGASYNYPNLLMTAMAQAGDTNFVGFDRFSIRGGRAMLGYRVYPLKRKKPAPNGFFFGPYVSYNFAKIKQRKGGNGSFDVIHYINANMTVGYQIVTKKGVSIEFMGGLGYKNNFLMEYNAYNDRYTKHKVTNPARIPVVDHVKILLQFNMGYCF